MHLLINHVCSVTFRPFHSLGNPEVVVACFQLGMKAYTRGEGEIVIKGHSCQ
jgi:hypothetical protein